MIEWQSSYHITQKKSFTEIKANQNGALWHAIMHHFANPL